MDESDEIAATVIQTPRRNVRRKLVQSTLLPHKSDDVIKPIQWGSTCNAGNKEEGEGGGGDGGFCSSQGKKTRKQRTPKKNGASNNKMAKRKSPGKSTPKKNATKNGTLAADDHMNVSPSLPNLRLEAKLRAENWTFTEQTSTTWSPHQPIKSDPLTHRLKEFDLNELPALSHPDASDKAEVVDGEAHQAVNLSNRVGGAADISHELQSISCRESKHMVSHNFLPEFLQICGNTDSVKLMNEWLGQWHERGFQPSKDFLSSDEEKSQDADYKCSESDSDSENTGAEDRLKNLLLIVGPVGSGKSAAIHACAKEQGFKILESYASECRSGAVVRQKFGEALKSYSLSRQESWFTRQLGEDRSRLFFAINKRAVYPPFFARKAKNTANPYSFDHEAGHALLPKIITQDFPSQLSQYVESEIAKSLSWKKLCSNHTDMKPYLDSEPVEAPQVLDLTHQITNLISEADLTCSRYLNLVAMEPTMNVSGDLDTSGYVLEQMTSIVAEQGFSFFTNQIATTVSFPTLSATMVLVVDETKKDHTWTGGSCLDMKPETHLDVLKCERMVLLSSVLESVSPSEIIERKSLP
ncbi:unnamed protein product [Brassica rapa subsp. narinosa]